MFLPIKSTALHSSILPKIIGSLGSLHTTGYRIKLFSSSIYVEIGKKGVVEGIGFMRSAKI